MAMEQLLTIQMPDQYGIQILIVYHIFRSNLSNPSITWVVQPGVNFIEAWTQASNFFNNFIKRTGALLAMLT